MKSRGDRGRTELSRLAASVRSSEEFSALPTGLGHWLGATIVAGLVTAEGIRKGGFWLLDAEAVAVASLFLLLMQFACGRADRKTSIVVAAICSLGTWWLVRGIAVDHVVSFLPFGASLLGFAAAFITMRALPAPTKDFAALVLATLGAAEALTGFAGLTLRWAPFAVPAQTLWRLSGTLTYSNAAGLALAIALLVGLGLNEQWWISRIVVFLCCAGAISSQSRGALVGLVCGAFLVPILRYRAMLIPLFLGIILGVVAVGTSPQIGPSPWVAGAVVVCGAAAALTRPSEAYRLTRRMLVICALVMLITLVVIGSFLHTEIGLRIFDNTSLTDRNPEWSGAVHQFWSSPWIGVGPDRIISLNGNGVIAYFAHNEYLQVAADGGIVGVSLLMLSVTAVVRSIRRISVGASCAAGALVAFAVGGAFDFDWHLPVLGLLGGWVAGMAGGIEAPTAAALEGETVLGKARS